MKILDPAKSVFLSRGATWTSYKKAMESDDVSVNLLEKFGLENTLVAMDVRKQDFHAKFFAGMSEAGCEVMSGSANLVRGPSVENISFQKISKAGLNERYIDRLKLKKPLPLPGTASNHWVLIDQGSSGWQSASQFKMPYLAVREPERAPEIGPDHAISKDAAKKIRGNAIDFLNGGLELLFADSLSSKTAKLAVISIQTSIELFAKYRLVKEDGLHAIVRGKFPSADIEDDAKRGKFNTIGFGEALDLINKRESMGEFEESLMKELVSLRNALVHFSSEVDPEDVKLGLVHILVSVLSMFALGEDRDAGEMDDYRSFLSAENFHALTNFQPYRTEAFDTAQQNLDTERVLTCYQCGNESFGLRLSESYFCYCCGFGVVEDAIAFSDCAVCDGESNVFYDPLNMNHGMHYGKCMECDTHHWVWTCSNCDTVVSQVESKKRGPCPVCD